MNIKEPTTHGAFLVDMVKQMDEFIEISASSGHLPVLDAIGTARLLKALIRGDHSFDPKNENLLTRRARFRQSVNLSMLDFGNYGWMPAPTKPTEEDAAPEQSE